MMVRINLINPRDLADQHLIAEYDEILMLLGYVRKYPRMQGIPESYRLGKGHITFFKDKLVYIKRRHDLLKVEMGRRGFVTNKTVDLKGFSFVLQNDWRPSVKDAKVIKERLVEKFEKKPEFYTYYGEHRSLAFFVGLTRKARFP